MGPMQDSKHNKYLGLPSIIGKSKKEVFLEVKEKVEKKIVRMERKNVIYGRKRDPNKGGSPSYSNIYYELFSPS